MRGDISLALSLSVPYDYVAGWDDRVKATYWLLIDELRDAQKDGG